MVMRTFTIIAVDYNLFCFTLINVNDIKHVNTFR